MHAPSRAEKFWLFVFLAVWCFFGLTGRDAWKAEEAQALTPILDWLSHGGLPYASPFPFHTLISGLFALLSQPWLDAQDGARLASGALTLSALLLTGLAAKRLFGPGYGAAAALALMGSFGLMLRAHALLPETTLLLGYAWLMHGVSLARQDTLKGAAAIALAGLVLSLSRGLPDLLATVLIVLLPLLSRDWRHADYRRAALSGLTGLAGLLMVWLAALSASGDHAVAAWWAQFTARLAPDQSPIALFNLLSWFAWPVWPLALWTLWHEHRRLAREPALHPVLAALVVTLAIGLWPTHSGGNALPALVPLALLAGHGVDTLKRGGAQGFYWFGVLCFMFFTMAFWVYFAALEWGWPQQIATHLKNMTPLSRVGNPGSGALLAAVAATLLWLVAIPLFPRAKVRPVLVWATGMALTWFLLILLFRPWAEAGWGYRPLIDDMARYLPANACLNAEVDPAMKAMLRLHLGARYRPDGECRYLLITRRAPPEEDVMREVWDGFRPRDRGRHYRLFVRNGA
jgi:4-amino-4-deoxy-L-arabinose transferase-like glycosyltransferase